GRIQRRPVPVLRSRPHMTDPQSSRYATNPEARLRYQNDVDPSTMPVAPTPMAKPPVASVMPTTVLRSTLPGATSPASIAGDRCMSFPLFLSKVAHRYRASLNSSQQSGEAPREQ